MKWNGVQSDEAIADVSKLIRGNGTEIVDLKFCDLPGLWQHFSIPSSEISEIDDLPTSIWGEGIGFDGSSIRGFQQIQESDMVLLPDPETAVVDPACEVPTVSVICDVYDPITKKPYTRDPRYVAKKAEKYVKESGIADASFWGPEYEFFIFNDIRFGQSVNQGFYFIDSVEGEWNSGKEENPNLGYKPRFKEGYFPVPPHDSFQDFRSEIILQMIKTGIDMEVHHHEVATAGQAEIDMRFGPLVKMADNCMMYKYIVKNIAKKKGMVATFMPKPLFGDNGSGMHTHQSLWKGGKNIFFDAKGYAMISQLAKYYIGGLLDHANALMAFCAPSTNSYKRLVPGYEAPVNLVYSMRNRSAAVRIPVYSENPKTKRIEFRPPDPTCNPYLSFAAMLMAGLDGVKKKMDPGTPFDKNTYEVSAAESKKIATVPGSLEQAIDALEEDHKFLLQGGVFTQDLIDVWIEYKRAEMDKIRLRPHPYEFHLYFDV
ncbi:MAG TPA: type I glutamate--ammonia ligase [Methanomicrobiales archaeon]|nr:type I glutamate--ammonia ligase [Methanomicrobiales archaeon]